MRIDLYKPTNGDFAGNFFDHTCKISLITMRSTIPYYRVCVWGNDDSGYEFDFDHEVDAKNMLFELVMLTEINPQVLIEKGFTRA